MYFEHANLTVSDLDRSIDFYQRVFGWQVRWRGFSTSSGRPAAHIGDDRIYIAMFESGKPGRWAIDYDTVGFNHVGLVVDDLDAMIQRLDELGVEHGEEQDYDPGRRVYFIDPDGMEIELVQYQAVHA